ncbi:MAG: ATP-binding protein, partial [Solirubrobacterales bacterium]|nr:ATP-binding protein [Solirubrobacterales bacterium]
MAVQEHRFVGRGPELALASRCLDAARQSQPQIVVIEGHAGIGKTAFLRQCIARAGDFVVLEAAAEESEASLEFGLVTQLLARAATMASDGAPVAPLAGGSPDNPFTAG